MSDRLLIRGGVMVRLTEIMYLKKSIRFQHGFGLIDSGDTILKFKQKNIMTL